MSSFPTFISSCTKPNSFACQDLAMQIGNTEGDICSDGCICPNDMRMNSEGKCVDKRDCDCSYEGKIYAANAILPQPDGSIKKCKSGVWLIMPKATIPICGKNMVWSPCLSDADPTCENMYILPSDSPKCEQGTLYCKHET